MDPNLQGMPAAQPKKSNMGIIIGVVVVVLLCCCCIVVIGGGLYVRSQTNNIFSSINQQLTEMPESILTSMPDMTSEPTSPDATPMDLNLPADAVPQGGLGDDVQRAMAWTYSLAKVMMSGCTVPVAKDTKIEVTQQPDSSGMWKERWTIACDGSASVPLDVTFTPAGNGVTDVVVDTAK
jgi:hypothetical protein